ncbi:MAG: hypothetical protein ABL962_05665 [Fimbriimonadaceae bacterium]
MRSLEWFARDRIAQFRQQAVSVSESDSLFPSAEAALDAIKGALTGLEQLLDKAAEDGEGAGVSEDDDALNQACVTVNQKLSALTTYLGIILRSSNTRNSFESYLSDFQPIFHATRFSCRSLLMNWHTLCGGYEGLKGRSTALCRCMLSSMRMGIRRS